MLFLTLADEPATPPLFDLEQLEAIICCFENVFGGYDPLDTFEAVCHEMAHVLDASGDVVLGRHSVGTHIIMLDSHTRRETNEARASVVTRKVFERLGFLDETWESNIQDNYWANIDADRRQADYWFEVMKDSKKTEAMAKRIIEVLCMWGVVLPPNKKGKPS